MAGETFPVKPCQPLLQASLLLLLLLLFKILLNSPTEKDKAVDSKEQSKPLEGPGAIYSGEDRERIESMSITI